MNINILIIILLLLFPIYILLKKLIIYLINRRKRETVRRHLAQEGSKKTQYSPSHNLKIMSDLMSPKYFSNIFYKEYLDVNRYNIGEEISIKKWLGMESSKMESNYYFNLVKNKMANNLFTKNTIPKKFWNNFILPDILPFLSSNSKQGFPENVVNVQIIFSGDAAKFPTQFFKNDIYICLLKGTLEIKYSQPSSIIDLDPYKCFPFTRKKVDDIETINGIQELREGDYIYIPNGMIFGMEFKGNYPIQTFFIIEFDNFLKNGKIDREVDFIKLEQLQMRKIPRKVYPKDLEKDELEILWEMNLVNGNIWDKNQLINNIL